MTDRRNTYVALHGSYSGSATRVRISLPCEPWEQPDMGAMTCVHPGCEERIARGSVSQTCRDHLHGAHCRCRVCTTGKTGARR